MGQVKLWLLVNALELALDVALGIVVLGIAWFVSGECDRRRKK